MKNYIKFLLLAPIALSSLTGCMKKKTEPKPVDVILISGQSNAVGCTHNNCIQTSIGSSAYYDYLNGYPGVQIAYDCWTKDVKNNQTIFYSQNKPKSESFVKVMLGQGNALSTFGPEIGIAESMHEKYEGKLFLIKYACGASNLKDDWLTRESPMYGRFINFVKDQMNNLVNMGYAPTIKAFCWMQGEGDAWDGYYQEYYENTKSFVANVREDLKELSGEGTLPFIDAGISNSKQWEFYRQVNNAKKQYSEESEYNYYIDTIAEGLHTDQEPFNEPDTAHYDSESEVLLGKLFAQYFEPFLMKVEE